MELRMHTETRLLTKQIGSLSQNRVQLQLQVNCFKMHAYKTQEIK